MASGLATREQIKQTTRVAGNTERLVTVVLTVSDLDRAVKLYGDGFGLDLHVDDHQGVTFGSPDVMQRQVGPTARSSTLPYTKARMDRRQLAHRLRFESAISTRLTARRWMRVQR